MVSSAGPSKTMRATGQTPAAKMHGMATTDVPLTKQEFELLRSLIYQQAGICLRETKIALLKSRLTRRLRHYGYHTFAQYYDHLKHHDPQGRELQEMMNAVTTNKTSFFRENHHFVCLKERVLEPARRAAAQGHRPALRLWSAGCSSGEEAYSMAITIADTLDRLATWDVKILATDIDTGVLEKGRRAIYSRDTLGDVPQQTLRKHFLSGKGKDASFVQVKPDLQKLVRFARLNLMEPWPFRGKFDAIFCRNVIIYFDRDSQRHVLEGFARYLKPGGLFFAGHSENLFWLGDFFQPIGRTVYVVGNPRSSGDA
jgi:chemotaxis protein methyltransferase CheR